MTTAQAFAARTRHEPGAAILDLSGKIDSSAEQELNAAYDEAEQAHPGLVVLNFSQVSYMNSTGIALIVGLLARARKTKSRLAVYGLSDHYMEIFRITRLSDFMDVYPSEETAFLDIHRADPTHKN